MSALGIKWNSKDDCFCFKISQSEMESSKSVTKRLITSDVTKLFDPVGWLSPVVIRAKILIQDLWRHGQDWDEPVPDEFRKSWFNFRNQLKDVESISIPRWLGSFQNSKFEMHCFCDASEKAFAAVIYFVVHSDDQVHSKLIASKSKVAPIKTISIPRLELCGAVVLSRLVTYVLKKSERAPSRVHCWSDSKVVLAWLKGHPSRWKTFVANGVDKISTTLPEVEWRHVVTADNTADLASRGVSPAELRDSQLWWLGPSWLCLPATEWPVNRERLDTELEIREVAKSHVLTSVVAPNWSSWLETKSNISRLFRIMAYVFRFIRNSRLSSKDRSRSGLTAVEIQAGRIGVFKLVQIEAFPGEIRALKNREKFPRSSSILRLTPYLDKEGLLRVGGRLQNSTLSESEKHQVILPINHHVTRLLIEKADRDTLHGGPALVLSTTFCEFWIVRARNTVRRIIRNCGRCVPFRARTLEQLMGPLPAVRLNPTRPFTYTGVDFAGPLCLKPLSCEEGLGFIRDMFHFSSA